jgi:hypothetical protein
VGRFVGMIQCGETRRCFANGVPGQCHGKNSRRRRQYSYGVGFCHGVMAKIHSDTQSAYIVCLSAKKYTYLMEIHHTIRSLLYPCITLNASTAIMLCSST